MRLAALALLALLGVPGTGVGSGGQTKLVWLADLEAAHEQAAREKKPLLIVFR